MAYRLAIVQHGDYAEALKIHEAGQPEPYTGMHYSVETLERLMTGTESLVVCLDAPRYRLRQGTRELVGFSRPSWRKLGGVPWSWMTLRAVQRFRPTHVLMRTGGLLAAPVLHYALKRDLNVMVVLAGVMTPPISWRDAWLNHRLVRMYNDPRVFLVANHRRPAADSLVAAGVRPEKVVAYDMPSPTNPADHPVKSAPVNGGRHVAYAGTFNPGKGIGDLVEAVLALNESGHPTRLTACGEGPEFEPLKRIAAASPWGKSVTFPGRVPNEQVRALMGEASVVCVPSRRNSSEGLPFVVSEALASRTPVIASDHPCLVPLLHDGEGVRYFPSGDVGALARLIREVTDDPAAYARLSEATAAAFAKVQCDTHFHELTDRWRASW